MFSTLLFIVSANIDARYEQTNYMSDLLKALTPTPSGWCNKTHYCKWNGVVCQYNRVGAITLPSSSLAGTLPPYITVLTSLTNIDLHNNSLTGPLPEFSELSALETVYLGHNNFTSIPEFCFDSSEGLRNLNLSNNLNLSP